MLRMSKLTDYGTLILARLGRSQELRNATDLANSTGLPLPTVSKVLKALTNSGLVASERGPSGGYRLTREPSQISAAAILDALEGPLALTECSGDTSHCKLESTCTVGSSWQRINKTIRDSLRGVSLNDLQHSERLSQSFTISLLKPNAAARSAAGE